MARKEIILVNFALTAGGTERYLSELSNYLNKKTYRISLILLKKENLFYTLDNEINIIEPSFEYKVSKLGKILYFFRIIFFIRKNIRKIRPSVIINAAFPLFFMLSIFGMRYPVILTIRCDPKKVSLIEGVKVPLILRKPLYHKSIRIIAQTAYAENILSLQFPGTKVITLPNFLGISEFCEKSRENIIVSAGRLKKSKGFDYLIKAFKETESRTWKLFILGEGPERKSLQDLIEHSNLESKVFLLGNKHNIHEYYAKSKIFAFTSLSEGFPNVLLEAMATPLACISFDIIAGPSDIIVNEKNGFLIEPMNISEYASKLQLLINDSNLREKFMSEAKMVRETFNKDKIGKHYIRLIKLFEN